MLILTDKQVAELETFLQELPGKYYLPTLKIFQKFAQENEQKQATPPDATKSEGQGDIKEV